MGSRSGASNPGLVAMHTKSGSAAGQALSLNAGVQVSEAVIVLELRCADDGKAVQGNHAALQLPLTAEQRTVLRGRRQTPCGQALLLQLPREGALCPGDRLTDAAGSVQVEVFAASEALMRVEADSTLELLQAAYHLGNRHVALELHDHELLLPQDPVLETMLQQRGLVLSHCQRPFLPEGGAYGRHSHP